MDVSQLPMGAAPEPVTYPHFPGRQYAFIWRNWPLVPAARLAEVLGARREQVAEIAGLMGLGEQPPLPHLRRGYVTIVRRNWHLLPYAQLMALLGWTIEEMDYALREGDGLFWWMGCYKPRLEPLHYHPPTEDERARAAALGKIAREALGTGFERWEEPPFAFMERLAQAPDRPAPPSPGTFSPTYCYSYFGSFRNPLADGDESYPQGYLAQLAARGVQGIWLHEPLYHLAPFPWDEALSARRDEYLRNLQALVARAKRLGMGVYLYLNEPRPMPLTFFEKYPGLKGVTDEAALHGQQATVCTSVPQVQRYLREGVASLCAAVPDLAGIFTITASESYTNCWSHHDARECPRCAGRPPEEVIAEVNGLLHQGIREAGSECRLIVWDWGWRDEWAPGIISRLPDDAWFMSVSEWSMPINRGGVESAIGEYSLSVVGPGPRATRHWQLARERGLRIMAKVQAGTTWELAAVPYLPVVATVARHAAALRQAGVDGLMLSWTLGGYPSPGMEVIAAVGQPGAPSPEQALHTVAARHFGAAAPAVVEAWLACSETFAEYPFSCGSLYQSPAQMGPANLLWGEDTGYGKIGISAFGHPLDGLEAWCTIYPPEVFAGQYARVAEGFDRALAALRERVVRLRLEPPQARALEQEMGIIEASALHFHSIANQVRFVLARRALDAATAPDAAARLIARLEAILQDEILLAGRLHALQRRDSRLGYEAACQYFYLPVDLAEKVVGCHDLLERWLPAQRRRHGVSEP